MEKPAEASRPEGAGRSMAATSAVFMGADKCPLSQLRRVGPKIDQQRDRRFQIFFS